MLIIGKKLVKTVVRARSIGILTLFLLTIENVLALNTGISPLDTGFEIIGNIFNITALQNENVAVGIARLLWFVLVYAVLFNVARRSIFTGDEGKKTSNIVAFVLAAISVFFVPVNVLMTGTSTWAVIIWSILLLAPALAALYFAFRKKEDRAASDYLVELIVLLFAIVLTNAMMGTLLEWYRDQFPSTANTIDSVVALAWLILFFAIFAKILGLLGSMNYGGITSKLAPDKLNRTSDKAADRPGDLKKAHNDTGNKPDDNQSQQPPSPLSKVSQTPVSDGLKISWTHSPAEEQINFYYVEKAPVSDELRKEFFAKPKEERLKQLEELREQIKKNPQGIEGWKGIAKTAENQYLDSRASKENALTISGDDTGKDMFLYAVRAINKAGISSPRVLAIESEKIEQIKPKPKSINNGNWNYEVPSNAQNNPQTAAQQNPSQPSQGIFLTFAGDYENTQFQMEVTLKGERHRYPAHTIAANRFSLGISGDQERKIYFFDRKIVSADVKAYDAQGNEIKKWGKSESRALVLRGEELFTVYAKITLKKEDTKALAKPEEKAVKEEIEQLENIEHEMEKQPDTDLEWTSQKFKIWHGKLLKAISDLDKTKAGTLHKDELIALKNKDKIGYEILSKFLQFSNLSGFVQEIKKIEARENTKITWGQMAEVIKQYTNDLEKEVENYAANDKVLEKKTLSKDGQMSALENHNELKNSVNRTYGGR